MSASVFSIEQLNREPALRDHDFGHAGTHPRLLFSVAALVTAFAWNY
ncbi:hypothetical protein AB7828_15180 [Tardiphaga sp. 215_C5_N2_1]|jgi:hypothetical protein